MLPPRPSVLALLVACLTSLCHAYDLPAFYKCTGNSALRLSDVELNTFSVTVVPEAEGEYSKVELRKLDGTTKVCRVQSTADEVELSRFDGLEQTLFKFFNTRFTEAQDEVELEKDARSDIIQSKFFIFDSRTAIPWRALDDPIEFRCDKAIDHPSDSKVESESLGSKDELLLVAHYLGEKQLATPVKDCFSHLPRMLVEIEKRAQEKLKTEANEKLRDEQQKARVVRHYVRREATWVTSRNALAEWREWREEEKKKKLLTMDGSHQ